MRRLRIVLWVLAAAAVLGFGILFFISKRGGQQPSSPLAGFTLGGPFTLTGSDGKPFSSSALKGKPHAMFFGFTHCPDVCPTTLARLVKLRKQLGGAPDRPAILFVTVDPERDGPAEVGKYAELFDAPVTGLTGSPAQIDQVKKKYGIFSKKVPTEGGDYTVDHTATVLLFDRNGEFAGTIAQEEGDPAAMAKLQRIVA